MPSRSKPVIIIVPGAWYPIEFYNPIKGLLEAQGYSVKGETHPSVSWDIPVQSFDADVALVRYEILNEIERGREVLIAPHSYGGVVASEASKGFTREERSAMGREGYVIGLCYMAAFALPVGESLLSKMPDGREPEMWQRGNQLSFIPPNMEKIFYGDMDPERARHFVSQSRPMSFRSMKCIVTFAAYEHFPSWYIWPKQDSGFAVKSLQYGAAEHMKEVFKINGSHSLNVDAPEVTARIIRHCAGEEIQLDDLMRTDFG